MRVEVEVRFAGDLVEMLHLDAGTIHWVGTTPVLVKAGTQTELGRVSITMTRAPAEQTVLPRARAERRPYAFGTASLIAHLAIVAIAFVTATSEPLTAPAIEASGEQPGGTRIKRFTVPAQTTERLAKPAPVEAPITVDQTPQEQIERDTPPPPIQQPVPSEMTGDELADGPKDGDRASRFDPAADPAFDTIKVGDYSTLSSGLAAGDGYQPHARNSSLVVITCDRSSCLVLGGEQAARIRRAVQEHTAELTDCYKHAAENGGGSIEIDFGINEAGTVQDLGVADADPAGYCVAKILRSLKFGDEA